jgi:hypothetical protein
VTIVDNMRTAVLLNRQYHSRLCWRLRGGALVTYFRSVDLVTAS